MALKLKFPGIVLVFLFFLLISVPLVVFFFQDRKELSVVEKRTLALRPSVPTSLQEFLDYPQKIEKYYNDHFGLREFFLDLYAKGKIVIGDTLGVNISDSGVLTRNVIEGKDGWYFLNRVWDGDPVSDYRNIDLYTEKQLSLAVLAIAARKHWLEKQGIEYLLFFAPNKHTVYAEYLPDYLTKLGDVSSMDQLYQALSLYTSVHFVDLRDVLIQSKDKAEGYWPEDKEEARLYWQTDSHWNGAGADIAQYTVALRMEEILPGMISPRLRNKDEFKMVQGKGDLASLMNDESLFAEKGPAFRQGSCSTATPEEFSKRQQVATCRTGKINVLIFHDSFFTALKPLFADYFARTVFLWERMSKKRLQENIAIHKPALVIEQLAERFLPYVPDITGESYRGFWKGIFSRSSRTLFALDTKTAAREAEGYRVSNGNVHFDKQRNALAFKALNGDPQLYLPDIELKADRLYLLKIKIIVPSKTQIQIFYSRRGEENLFPSAEYSKKFRVNKGNNTLYVPLLSGDLGQRFRFDPGMVAGNYGIKAFEIREIGLDEIQ